MWLQICENRRSLFSLLHQDWCICPPEETWNGWTLVVFSLVQH